MVCICFSKITKMLIWLKKMSFWIFKTASGQEPKLQGFDPCTVKTSYNGSKLRNRC